MANFYGQFIGFGAGGGAAGSPFHPHGESYGFHCGGHYLTPAPVYYSAVDTIEKYPFASDTDGSDVEDLNTLSTYHGTGSSSTHGYKFSGVGPTGNVTGYKEVNKFAFTSTAKAADIGDLTVNIVNAVGTSSETVGYCISNRASGYAPGEIEKVTFASDAIANYGGNLLTSVSSSAGFGNGFFGYTAGGVDGASGDVCEKFSYASEATSTDVGNLVNTGYGQGGQQSPTHGFVTGGTRTGVGKLNVIQSRAFASDGDFSDLANLSVARDSVGSNNSLTHGYTAGGYSAAYDNTVDKFAFESTSDAGDVGNLTRARSMAMGSWQ